MTHRRHIAAVALAVALPLAMLSAAGAANPGPQELSEHVRQLLEGGDLPTTADDAVIEITDDGDRMLLTGRELKAAFLQQLRLTTGYRLKEFTVDRVECQAETCTIRYQFRTWTKFANRELSQSVHSEEEYRVTAGGFTLIRARQVQHKEDEL